MFSHANFTGGKCPRVLMSYNHFFQYIIVRTLLTFFTFATCTLSGMEGDIISGTDKAGIS